MRNVVRTSKVTQYGKDIHLAIRKMPATGIDKAKKMYDAVLDKKVPRFLPQEEPVGVSADFAQQTVRDVLKSTSQDTMQFMKKITLTESVGVMGMEDLPRVRLVLVRGK